MKYRKSRVAAAVIGVSAMAGQAWAEEVCAGAQDLTALQVASIQQQLMVAALACETDQVTLYNQFVTNYQPDLIASDEALQSYFTRRNAKTGAEDYHSFKTKMANYFSARSGDNRPGYCGRAETLFHQALAGRKQSLAAFALAQPMSIDAGYTACGQSVKGESFAYAAVKEEQREERAAAVAPAIAAAPPPPVVPARDAYREYAQNLAPARVPATPSYAPQPQSSCTRMSNSYLECWYGDFHYFRDPYGRYLPPPAYRR